MDVFSSSLDLSRSIPVCTFPLCVTYMIGDILLCIQLQSVVSVPSIRIMHFPCDFILLLLSGK